LLLDLQGSLTVIKADFSSDSTASSNAVNPLKAFEAAIAKFNSWKKQYDAEVHKGALKTDRLALQASDLFHRIGSLFTSFDASKALNVNIEEALASLRVAIEEEEASLAVLKSRAAESFPRGDLSQAIGGLLNFVSKQLGMVRKSKEVVSGVLKFIESYRGVSLDVGIESLPSIQDYEQALDDRVDTLADFTKLVRLGGAAKAKKESELKGKLSEINERLGAAIRSLAPLASEAFPELSHFVSGNYLADYVKSNGLELTYRDFKVLTVSYF
jgi:hypothetical protein